MALLLVSAGIVLGAAVVREVAGPSVGRMAGTVALNNFVGKILFLPDLLGGEFGEESLRHTIGRSFRCPGGALHWASVKRREVGEREPRPLVLPVPALGVKSKQKYTRSTLGCQEVNLPI